MANVPDARQKLGKAVLALATGVDGIRSRLAAAHLAAHTLRPEEFPDAESRELWGEINAALTSRPGPDNKGAVQATLEQMADQAAVDVARKFVELNLMIHRRYTAD
jgi:hypothetical protein